MKKATIILMAFALLVFVQCKQQPAQSETVTKEEPKQTEEAMVDSLTRLGNEIKDISQKTLGGQLMMALGEGGVAEAVHYCKLNAFPIVEELSEQHGATISRKAVQYRNPANEAKGQDAEVFAAYARKLAEGIALAPEVILDEGSATYYHPIMMADFCTACHGSKEVIGEDYALISEAYPNDLAIGFEAGDLRGIWKVEFKR